MPRRAEGRCRLSRPGRRAAAAAAAVQGLAGRLGSVAEIAAGVANDYQVAESEFTEKLVSMGGPK